MTTLVPVDQNCEGLIPPQSLDAEQSVLGAVLKDEAAMGLAHEVLKNEQDFYAPKHRLIYRACLELYVASEPVDVVTVVGRLTANGHLEQIGGRSYIVELLELAPFGSNVQAYAKIVLDKAIARRLIETCNEAVRGAYTGTEETDDLIEMVDQGLTGLVGERGRSVRSLSAIIENHTNNMLRPSSTDQNWFETRIADLNFLIGGFNRGEMVIVAGKPSQGKTSFALDFVLFNCRWNKKSLIFSIDQTERAVVSRLMGNMTGIPAKRLETTVMRGQKWSADEERTIVKAATQLATADCVSIASEGSYSALDIRSIARNQKRRHGLDIVLVDYVQQVRPHGNRKENRNLELAATSGVLKEMAKELDVCVVVISQIRRDNAQFQESAAGILKQIDSLAEKHESMTGVKWRFPNMSMLRDSGALEQDANMVIFPFIALQELKRLCGDNSFEFKNALTKAPELNDLAYIVVDKSKDTETGVVPCKFKAESMKFISEDKYHG